MSESPVTIFVQAQQTCARCGHRSGDCEKCDRTDKFLGGMIGGQYYCHTFSPSRPTCYELSCWESS